MEALCNKVILLDEGKIIKKGKPIDVITKYVKDYVPSSTVSDTDKQPKIGNGKIQITDFWIENESRVKIPSIICGQACYFVFKFRCPSGSVQKNVDFGYAVKSYFDQPLFLHYLSYQGQQLKSCPPRGKFVFKFNKFPLSAAQYKLGFRLTTAGQEADYLPEGFEFTVVPGDFYQKGVVFDQGHSPFNIEGVWSVEK